jgi:hypothetical protein
MRDAIRFTKQTAAILWWLLRLPFRVFYWLYGGCGKLIGAGFLLSRDALPCPGCGREVSLLGRWQCTCNYVYDGFYFSLCPVCGTQPSYIRCERCGVGIKNPLLFP